MTNIKYLDIGMDGSKTHRREFRWWLSGLFYNRSIKVSGLTGE